MVNVMGDALATGIMAHICRKDFVKEGEQVRVCKANKQSMYCLLKVVLGVSSCFCYFPPVSLCF